MDNYKVIELVGEIARAKYVSKETYEQLKHSLKDYSLKLKVSADHDFPYQDDDSIITHYYDVEIFDSKHVTLVVDSGLKVIGFYVDLLLKDYCSDFGSREDKLFGYQSLDGKYYVHLSMEISWHVGTSDYSISLNVLKDGERLTTTIPHNDRVVNKTFDL